MAKMAKMAKMTFIGKNRLMSLKLSKFTPSTAQQSADHSDERLKSYGQKTSFLGHLGQNGQKQQFFAHIFLTAHRNDLPIAALYSG